MEGDPAIFANTGQKSEKEDFSEIFKLYYTSVVHSIERIVKERGIAEDLAQDVFWRLYHVPWKEIRNYKAFLAKSGINAAYNYLRSAKRKSARWERMLTQSGGTEPSAEESWLRLEEIEMARDVLEELDERDRSLLILRFEGFSYKEIAEALSIDAASVGTLLSRAKQSFREQYLRKGER